MASTPQAAAQYGTFALGQVRENARALGNLAERSSCRIWAGAGPIPHRKYRALHAGFAVRRWMYR